MRGCATPWALRPGWRRCWRRPRSRRRRRRGHRACRRRSPGVQGPRSLRQPLNSGCLSRWPYISTVWPDAGAGVPSFPSLAGSSKNSTGVRGRPCASFRRTISSAGRAPAARAPSRRRSAAPVPAGRGRPSRGRTSATWPAPRCSAAARARWSRPGGIDLGLQGLGVQRQGAAGSRAFMAVLIAPAAHRGQYRQTAPGQTRVPGAPANPGFRTPAGRSRPRRPASGLVLQALCRGGALFDQRRVLLRHLVQLADRAIDLADALALLVGGGGDVADQVGNLAGVGHDLTDRLRRPRPPGGCPPRPFRRWRRSGP
jgi:hypothetical protein